MAVLLFTLLGYVASIALFIYGITLLDADRMLLGVPLMILSIGYWIAGIFLFCGLKVLKPQEALVLTLFGDYIGTLKGQGFYWVNPFCTAVNPAAGTRLSQSGDVNSGDSGVAALLKSSNQSTQLTTESASKKISLKMMTLNNSRQKINDCLGNPVEIGIAVIWRVTDTAKAAFNVDNYKEYLSLQCDSALRNVVRVYPYDVAPNVDTTGDGVADEGSLRGSSEVVAAPHPRRDPEKRGRGRHRGGGSPHHLSGLCAGDRSGHAAAPAGQCHHRRPQDDRGRCRGHGGNGTGPSERKQGGRAG